VSSIYIVLGATGGIGKALVKMLSHQGCKLVLGARNNHALQELANDFQAHPCVVDASQPGQIENCVHMAQKIYGRIDGIANCIGSLLLKPAHLTTDQEWQNVIQTNLTSAFETVRAAGKTMKKTGGSVVLVSSAAAQAGIANHEAIAASKAGINGLVLSASATYARQKIRFNAIAPGLVRTPLTEKITSNELSLKSSIAMHALGRIGDPDDIASAIAWFLDNKQSWITGQILGVDGGLANIKSRSH
jgi:NAD(P)-dependent dehydrogenase (short-subunit alcohol dehydrogenase family)